MLIKGLYETHVFVTNLEASSTFYQNLGLQLAHIEEKRRVHFFWIGEPQQAMLGVWEVPSDQWVSRHFAFSVDLEDMKRSVSFLKEKGIAVRSFSNDGTEDLEVGAWTPAVSIFFRDLDGNSLEFLSVLPDHPRPELGVVKYAEWERIHGRR